MTIALGLLLILALTAATGYFVAMEFAYVAVDRSALKQLASGGDEPAQRALKVTSRLSFTLSAAQFGITVTALLVGYVSEPLVGVGLAEVLDPSLSYAARLSLSVTLVLVFSTVVQMVFGELAPKNLAIARTVPLARALGRSTLLYLTVAGPVVHLFDRASTRLLRRVGIEPVDELEQGATTDDLSRIIDESRSQGLLDQGLSEALVGGLRFRELDAGDVMTPRVRVTTVPSDEPVSRLVGLLDTGWSRFPVTGSDGDDILGVAGISEVLKVGPDARTTTTIGSVTPEPTVVPTSAPLARVLDQLRADHRQMAVVVDEHGGFAGVVTFEDIAEEIVGDIRDEGDDDVAAVTLVNRGEWIVLGQLRLDELETATGVRVTSVDEYATISGLILGLLGRVVRVGDVALASGRRAAYEPTGIPDADSGGEPSAGRAGRADRPDRPDEPPTRRSVGAEPHPPTSSTRVSLRLTVVEVDRHVPSSVRVEVLGPEGERRAAPRGPADADEVSP